MPEFLTAAQILQFRPQGYVFPFWVVSLEQAADTAVE